jgi:hypothetical protein
MCFILQFILLGFVLMIFSGGQSIVFFFIQPPSQVQSKYGGEGTTCFGQCWSKHVVINIINKFGLVVF